jgi:carbonic anhydrase
MNGNAMRKILHFDSPRENYRCEAAVLWCFDNRFELALRKLLKRLGVQRYDPVRVAGGAKSLASPDRESEREFVLGQIRASVRLHGTGRVILMVHSDCGGYGGLAAFGGDEQAEIRHHREELRRAAAAVRANIPDLSVHCYFVNFEGVWALEEPAGAAAR